MSITDTLLPEFDQEMATTRRVIERVPDDKPEWKPHPKSFCIAHLAQLLSWMPGWIGQTLTNTELDLASGAGYSLEKTSTLLEALTRTFARHVRQSPRRRTPTTTYRGRSSCVGMWCSRCRAASSSGSTSATSATIAVR